MADKSGHIKIKTSTGFHRILPYTHVDYVIGISSYISTAIAGKQNTLVSGTNIKTINSNSILGSGNIDIVQTETDPTVPSWAKQTTLQPSAVPELAQSKITNLTTDLAGKADLSGATFSGAIATTIVKNAYHAYNVHRFFTTTTPVQTVIYTKIKNLSSTHMPVVRIYGYAYGAQSPIELKIGFYIYGGALGWSGVVSMGAWRPAVYLFFYTEGADTFVAIGLVGSLYYLGFQVDVQLANIGSIDGSVLTTGWTSTSRTQAEIDGGNTIVPAVGVSGCVAVPYKSTLTTLDIQFNAVSQGIYDGVTARTINITPANIGAAASSHTLLGHTVAGLTAGHFLKATGPTTFGFAAHGLGAADVGAEPAFSKNTGFNKAFGTTAGTVSEGNHTHAYLATSLKGAANGLAELDANSKVPAAQLPSYVDDVIQHSLSTYASIVPLQSMGTNQGISVNVRVLIGTDSSHQLYKCDTVTESTSTWSLTTTFQDGSDLAAGKIYLNTTNGKIYRLSSGSTLVEISSSIALGETSATAYRGDRGKTAYDHSLAAHAPSDAQKNSDITKAEIEAVLTGAITSHTHAYLASSHAASGVTTTKISNWDTAYGWGDHASKIFLKSNTDNRTVATIPNDYNSKFEIKGLKGNSYIGLTGGGTYSALLGLRGWTDSSGGNSHELAFDGNGRIYHRHGATTTWGSWLTLIESDDPRLTDARPASDVYSWAKASTKPTYTAADVGALASTHAASGVTTTKIQNWDDAYSHSNDTGNPHYVTAAQIGAADKLDSIYYVLGNAGGTSGVWTGTISRISGAIPVGTCIAYHIKTAGGSSGTTLNINGTGAVTCLINISTLTTHFATDSIIFMVYDGTYWKTFDYNTNTTYSAMSVSEGQAGTQTTLRTMRADYLKSIIEHHALGFGSGSDFANGTLIQTTLDAAGAEGDSWTIEIKGKGYGLSPINIIAEGYNYNNTFINVAGYNYGTDAITYIKVLKHTDNKLAFWVPRLGYWNSYDVFVKTTSTSGRRINCVTSISNSAEPSSDKKVQINLVRAIFEGDSRLTNSRPASDVYAWAKEATKPSYIASDVGALPISGGTLTGALSVAYAGGVNFALTSATSQDVAISLMRSGAAYLDWRMRNSGGNLLFDMSSNDGTSWTSYLFLGGESPYLGRLGVGTSTPGYKLDVVGDINISSGSKYKINGTNLSAADVGAEPSRTTATETEMQAGTGTTVRGMTPQRVKQATTSHVATEVTSSRNLATADYAQFIRANHASTEIVFTIPENLTINDNAEIHIARFGDANVSITPQNANVTLYSEGNKRKINEKYQVVTLKRIAANVWLLFGALKS